jgi:MOSC domain-containing protein YiiM
LNPDLGDALPTLLSVNVGQPRELPPPPKGWRGDPPWRKRLSAIFKEPVAGAVWLGALGLEGDRQVDRKYHGGVDRAVNVYSADHFPDWRVRLDRPDLANGAFGENFTVAGLDEQAVCIGDSYAIGEVVVRVTQPREPCWKLARKLDVKDLVVQVEQLRRTGWYLRVLQEGRVEAGMTLALLERPHPEWTIARAYATTRARATDPEAAAILAACPALAADWRTLLLRAPKAGKRGTA